MRISNKKWHRVKLRNRRIYKKAENRRLAKTAGFRSFRQLRKWRRSINKDLNKKRRKAHSPSIAAGLGGVSFLGY